VVCVPPSVEFIEGVHCALHLLVGRHKVCDSEMVRAFLLLEAAAGDCDDSGLVHHVHAVQEVGLLALLLRFVNELFAEVHLREAVHGALNRCAGDVFHRGQTFLQKCSLTLVLHVDVEVFVLVLIDTVSRLNAKPRWVAHQLDRSLTDCVSAQVHAFQLENKLKGLWWKVVALVVASAEATFAEHAFRD